MLLNTKSPGITDQREGKLGVKVRLTVEPFGVVLRGAERGQHAQTSVNGGIASGEIHGRGCVDLPARREESRGIVPRAVRTARHAADLIMDFRQVTQLGVKTRQRNKLSPRKPL